MEIRYNYLTIWVHVPFPEEEEKLLFGKIDINVCKW